MSKNTVIKSDRTEDTGVKGLVFENFGEKPPEIIKPGDEKVKTYDFKPLPGIGGPPGMTIAAAQDVLDKADEIIEKAGDEAKRILEEAGKDVEKIKEEGRLEGYNEGFPDGHKAGWEEGLKEIREIIKPLKAIGALYRDLDKNREAEFVKLALTVAEKVVLHEIKTEPELIVSAFKAALNTLDRMHSVTLKINPEDFELLQDASAEAVREIKGLTNITFETDPHVNRGDLVMDTEAGRLDGTIKTRFAAVAEAVENELKKKFELGW